MEKTENRNEAKQMTKRGVFKATHANGRMLKRNNAVLMNAASSVFRKTIRP